MAGIFDNHKCASHNGFLEELPDRDGRYQVVRTLEDQRRNC
jgi:hypothetical protein